MKATYQLSERTACDLTNISRTGYRYVAKPKNDEPLRTRLIELAAKHPGLGYLMLHGILKSEGLVVTKSVPTDCIVQQDCKCAPRNVRS